MALHVETEMKWNLAPEVASTELAMDEFTPVEIETNTQALGDKAVFVSYIYTIKAMLYT